MHKQHTVLGSLSAFTLVTWTAAVVSCVGMVLGAFLLRRDAWDELEAFGSLSYFSDRWEAILAFAIGIGAILLAEWLWPPSTDHRVITTNVWHDFVWMLLVKVFSLTVFVWYIKALSWVYSDLFRLPQYDLMAAWPVSLKLIVAFLFVDFVKWGHHFMRHKIRPFWHFHAVHHSQQRVNLFTQHRFHPVESLVASTIEIVPALMLGLAIPSIIAFKVFLAVYAEFLHSSVQVNFGPLKYVLVTPQSHRLHHSCQPEHRDKNLGIFLSIWDRMFGTHCEPGNAPPMTGIHDQSFPQEKSYGPLSTCRILLAQLIYPFRALARDWGWQPTALPLDSNPQAANSGDVGSQGA